MSVDDRRNGVVVNVTTLSSDELDGSDAFLLSLMSEHRSWDDVTDGENVGDARLEVTINRDSSLVIELDANLLCVQTIHERTSTRAHQDVVSFQSLQVAALHWLHHDRTVSAMVYSRKHFMSGEDLETLMLKRLRECLRDVSVEERAHSVRILDDCHIRAQSPVN